MKAIANIFNFCCIILLTSSCSNHSQTSLHTANVVKIDTTNFYLTSRFKKSDSIQIQSQEVPDSIKIQIHKIIDRTSEYIELKKIYEHNQFMMLVSTTEKKAIYEVEIGHVIFDRFSNSLRLEVDLNSKEIKVYDFDTNSKITLADYRSRLKNR